MKTIITILLGIILLSATTLAEKSTSQVIITNTNIEFLKSQINSYYRQGYRVTEMTAQPISYHPSTGLNGYVHDECTKVGIIIVIMEK